MADNFQPLIKEMVDAIDAFQKAVPTVQKQLFKKIIEELQALDLKNGNVAVNVKNVRLITKIKAKLLEAILTDEYKAAVKEYLKAFESVTALQNSYFSTIEKKFTPSKLGAEIKTQSVDAVVDNLTERGIDANVIAGVENILKTSITTGGSVADLQEQLRNNILSNDTGAGALERYTRQITTDALNQYSAQYTQIIASDLGLEWFRYSGSLIETSREFCIACRAKEWIHISEFQDLLDGNFAEFEEAGGKMYKGLPEGMIPDTNVSNFPIYRGGFNCGHSLRPVRESAVPEAIRNRIKG
jgi:hypothetical protein